MVLIDWSRAGGGGGGRSGVSSSKVTCSGHSIFAQKFFQKISVFFCTDYFTFLLGKERGRDDDQKSDLAMKVLQKLPFLPHTKVDGMRKNTNANEIFENTRKAFNLLSSGLLLGADKDPCC